MKPIKFWIAGSSLALALATMMSSTRAAAQFVCDSSAAGESGAGAAAVGPNDVACGTGAQADVFFIGGAATAIGANSEAFGSATAVGAFASANGPGALAIGAPDAGLSGDSAFANGRGDIAIGAGASASFGDFSVALGFQAATSSDGAVAIGGDADASGVGAQATAANATALGADASAIHTNSVAIGAGTTTTAANQVNVGGRTISGVTNGAVNATSTDVVTGQQLFTTNTNVTANTTAITAIQAVNTTQATQITALQAADTALDTRVDALEGLALDFNDDLDRVDDRAAAGTATAVALSGAMFLPGKTFNLTGNVGAYRGAVAGALQIGALVSETVALNAGVAHGFNKGGKTALRAGFTFGW